MVLTWLRKLAVRKSRRSSKERHLTDHRRWKYVKLYAERLEDRIAPAFGSLLHSFSDPNNAPNDDFGSAVAAVETNLVLAAPNATFSGKPAGPAATKALRP